MWRVLADGYGFLEAPRFDPQGWLYFTDLMAGGLYRRDPDGTIRSFLPQRDRIGGVVVNQDGSLVCGGRGGLIRFDPESGEVVPLLSEIAGRPIDSVNDIEADRRGAIYAGTIDFTAILDRGKAPEPGLFFRLAPGGPVEPIRDDVRASNGIAFSPAQDRLYHSETGVGIWVYDLPADGGLPENGRLLIAMEDSDGLVVDAAGALWIARWQKGQVCRCLPDGTIERTIDFPWQISSLAFGDVDLKTLYLTCGAPKGGEGGAALLRGRVDVPGQPVHLGGF